MGTLWNLTRNLFDPNAINNEGRATANQIASPYNKNFRNNAINYQKTADKTTGQAGYNSGYNMAKPNASEMTRLQSNGAGAQALGNAVSAGGTRGRAADSAGQTAANTYSNNYASNMNAQQGMANQALANQLNAQGTLMGANLTNDQAEYQQVWNNQQQGTKMNFGLGALVGSDKKLKDSVKVGLGDEDLRMTHYKHCGEKLKHMNPNKWTELKWEAK